MEEGTILRKIFFGDKLDAQDEVTSFHLKLFDVYSNWKDFKEFPYNRNGPDDQKIPFWKYVIRGLTIMEAEARRYKQDRRKPTEKQAGGDPRKRRARVLPYQSRKVSGSDKKKGFKQWKMEQLAKSGFKSSKESKE